MIPISSLKLILKVAKGCEDAVKEEWLNEAAALSYSDFKKRIDEALGKAICDCAGKPVEKIVLCCPDCGKRIKQEESDIGPVSPNDTFGKG
jgi:hypothetical protein